MTPTSKRFLPPHITINYRFQTLPVPDRVDIHFPVEKGLLR